MLRTNSVVVSFALACALASGQTQAAPRTFVASNGLDANTASNCSLAQPCRNFSAAQTVTDSNGEIVALDSAGYGTIIITKSLAIIAPVGVYAGVSAPAGVNGVQISTPGVNVTLRGLTIIGRGGGYGVRMTFAGASLSIENCVFSNFSEAESVAIMVQVPARVSIIDTVLRNNETAISIGGGATASITKTAVYGSQTAIAIVSGNTNTTAAISDVTVAGGSTGIYAISGGTAAANVSVTRSTVSGMSFAGVRTSPPTGGPVVLTISRSMVTGNGTGLLAEGASDFRSLGDNTVNQNGSNASGITTITPL